MRYIDQLRESKDNIEELRNQGYATEEINDIVLQELAAKTARNVLVLGVLGLIMIALPWRWLLWAGVVVFGYFTAIKSPRAVIGIFEDFAVFFNPSENYKSIAASFVTIAEVVIYVFILYLLLGRLGIV